MNKDSVIEEYKRRIEKVKSEEELEKIALDEIKELKKNIFIEYEQNKEQLNELKEQTHKQEKKLIELQNKKIKGHDYVIQMNDESYELVSKDDIEIVDDLGVIKKTFGSKEEKDTTLLQIHFTDIDKDKYKELQGGDWCPFVDLMDYGAHIEIRFYNQSEDKLISLEWDIPREDVIKLKDLYVKEDSFWLEPSEGEDYSYMALIWNTT